MKCSQETFNNTYMYEEWGELDKQDYCGEKCKLIKCTMFCAQSSWAKLNFRGVFSEKWGRPPITEIFVFKRIKGHVPMLGAESKEGCPVPAQTKGLTSEQLVFKRGCR